MLQSYIYTEDGEDVTQLHLVHAILIYTSVQDVVTGRGLYRCET